MEAKYKLGLAMCALGVILLLGAAVVYMDRDMRVTLLLTLISSVWVMIAYRLIDDIKWERQQSA